MASPDARNLERFLDPQNGVYAQACAELRNGQKELPMASRKIAA